MGKIEDKTGLILSYYILAINFKATNYMKEGLFWIKNNKKLKNKN